MRYLFLDRILCLERNKQVAAIKNVTLSEDVYADHFFGSPITPGALLIECLAQAGTALLEVSLHYRSKALLIAVDQTKFRSLVRPGDQLKISMKMISLHEDSAQMDGEVRVGERLMMNSRMTFALKDAVEFYSEKTRFMVESIYEIWLKDAVLIGF